MQTNNTMFNASSMAQSKMNTLNQTARTILAQKDAEIQRLNREIDEAEQFLNEHAQDFMNSEANMKNEIQSLEQQLIDIKIRSEQDMQFLKEKQQREINMLTEKHNQEVQKLKKQIKKASIDENDISSKQTYISEMAKKPLFSKNSLSDFKKQPSYDDENDDSNSLYTDPHLLKDEKRAKELQREVDDLESELGRLVNEQKQKEIQIQKEKEEAKKKKIQARTVARQKLLQEKENELKSQIKEIKDQYKTEIDQLQNELKNTVEQNSKLDNELAKILAENTSKANDLDTIKANPPIFNPNEIPESTHTTTTDTPTTTKSTSDEPPVLTKSTTEITSSAISPRKRPSGKTSSTAKGSISITTLKDIPTKHKGSKKTSSSALLNQSSHDASILGNTYLDAEIIRLSEENHDLKKELRRLDKLAYVAPPR